MKKYDIAIIGGGVVGSNIFYEISKHKVKTILLEAENDVGTGASGANSGIIHAGYDCKTKTMKAKFNVRGNQLFEKLCKDIDVKFKNVGSLVVCEKERYKDLKDLYMQGLRNGVEGLEIVQGDDLKMLEPNLADNMFYGLYAKSASVVSSYELSYALCQSGIMNGGVVELNFKVDALAHNGKCYEIKCGDKVVRASYVINAAGSGFNIVNTFAGAELYPVKYRRGEYYILDNSEKGLVNHIVFPLPSEKGKGVLVVPTTAGNILLGPTSEKVDSSDCTNTTRDGLEFVKKEVMDTIKGINFKKVIKTYSGVRTISGNDFIVEKSSRLKNYITVGGICSPGLTSAPAIAEYVVGLVERDIMLKKKSKICYRWRVHYDDEMLMKSLIEHDPDYGEIVCKCEKISLGEVKRILNAPLPPTTVDGLKRRLRSGMGRCQGSFCSPIMHEILRSYAQKKKIK